MNQPTPSWIARLLAGAELQQSSVEIERVLDQAQQQATARAAQEPEKKQFHLIICVMCERHRGQPKPLRCPRKKLVAQLARGHLHRPTARARQGLHVSAFNHALQPEPGHRTLHKARIPRTRRAAQPVVVVRGHQPPTVPRRQCVQSVQQHHGVHPARHRDQHARARFQQPALADAAIHVGHER